MTTHSYILNVSAMLAISTLGCGFSGGVRPIQDAGADSSVDANVDAMVDASVVRPILFEAEDFDRYNPGPDTSFAVLSSQAGFNGAGYVEAMRSASTGTLCNANAEECATIEFDFEMTEMQILFLNLRAWAENKDSNALAWEIRPREGAPSPIYKDKDGNVLTGIPLLLGIPDYKPEWQSYTKKNDNVTLEAGLYTLVLFVRESGLRLDQLSITQ